MAKKIIKPKLKKKKIIEKAISLSDNYDEETEDDEEIEEIEEMGINEEDNIIKKLIPYLEDIIKQIRIIRKNLENFGNKPILSITDGEGKKNEEVGEVLKEKEKVLDSPSPSLQLPQSQPQPQIQPQFQSQPQPQFQTRFQQPIKQQPIPQQPIRQQPIPQQPRRQFIETEKKELISDNPEQIKMDNQQSFIRMKRCPRCNKKLKRTKVKNIDGILNQEIYCKRCGFKKILKYNL